MAKGCEYIPVTSRHIKGLTKILKYFETQTCLAESLGLSRQTVNSWFKGRKVIPEKHAIRLVNMVQERVDFYDLRPDFIKKDKKDLQYLK